MIADVAPLLNSLAARYRPIAIDAIRRWPEDQVLWGALAILQHLNLYRRQSFF